METLQMDKKDETNDLLDLDDCLKVGGDLPKEKGQEQPEKKILSVSNEDGEVALHEKGNMGGDDDKKRKTESIEENHLNNEKAQIEGKELGPVGEPDRQPRSRKEKKRKHGNNNAQMSCETSKDENMMVSDEVVHGKEQGPANESDCDPKSGKEKRRKHKVHRKKLGSDNVSMLHEISIDENMGSDEVVHEKEQNPADEPDCGPKPRNEKKRKLEVNEKELGNDNVLTGHENSKVENVASDVVVCVNNEDVTDEPDCGPNSRQEKKRKHEVIEKKLGNDNAPTSNEISKSDNEVTDAVVHGHEPDFDHKSRQEKKHEIHEKEHENDDVPTSHEISKGENVVSDAVVHGKEHGAVDEPDCDPKSRQEKHEIHEKEHENNDVPTSHEISKGEIMVSDEVGHRKEHHGPIDEPDSNPESRKETDREHEVHENKLVNTDAPTSHEIPKGEIVVSDEVVHSESALDEDPSKTINDIVDAVTETTQTGEKESNAPETKKTGDAKASEASTDDSMAEGFENVDKKQTTNMKKTDKVGCSTSQGQESLAGESDFKSSSKTHDIEDKKKKSIKACDNNSEEAKMKGKSKKVSFSGKVDVSPSSVTDHKKPKKKQEDNLVRGKRFTPEEDEIVKEAVFSYIKARNLGEDGLKKVMTCNAYPELRNCWKDIGTCIPYRPYSTVYYRAHILFERAEKRTWTKEETEFLKKSYEKHGNNWKMMAEELGKHRIHVKDQWRRNRLPNKKGGRWSQEEYQNLHDLVNLDLQMKVGTKERKSKHGMLRDNIPWGAISDKLSTRTDSTCCHKWYKQLTSSLVEENKWSNADDYRLVSALYDLDATCVEDVDWDALLDHRPGDVCRKRWDQMVLHIGHRGSQPFSEQVETLSKRYCPDLAEVREAWDNKPLVQ